MAKSVKERKEYLNEFQCNLIKPISDRLEALLKEDSKKNQKESETLQKYLSQLRSNLLGLHGDTLNDEAVKKFFDDCQADTAVAAKELNTERSWPRFFIDVIKDIANFCIKLLTLGKSPQFFNTTSKPVDSTLRSINLIKKNVAEFVETLEPETEFKPAL